MRIKELYIDEFYKNVKPIMQEIRENDMKIRKKEFRNFLNGKKKWWLK